ncbi:olfactory receptor 1361-like [Hippopotamus amphibius kiboko]|uniref:olfactory receptor 1361-like n=1 Tax=Hippopotamus amphibius kiboko TaxID=575201 RepID=UPI002592A7EF|nr:olfactory receptor 1361-like [Hippopotamus amphibius kiboko]
MRPENQSSMFKFLLLGLPIPPEQQGVFFALFLGMYLTTVLGNLLILLLIRLDSRLHTPVYFFLSHLAFSDISFSSVTIPKMLMNMQTQCQSITYAGCISQVYFFIFFGCLDSFLLAVMAYDRYVAVCHPLHYTTIMRDELCVTLVAGCWFASCAQALLHTFLVDRLKSPGNQSSVTEFLLLGLFERSEQQPLLFGVFLAMYLVTMLGNLLIILAVHSDPRLHTPMYFFLANLSLADACFSSTTVPKMLVNIQMHSQTISYGECLAQMHLFMTFGALDDFLLGVMAYDRYVAICRPLHYTTLMNLFVCVRLLAACWVLTNFPALLHTLLMAGLSFCAGNTIHHFFCDVVPLLQLSCSDTSTNQVALYTMCSVILTGPLSLIILSYVHIISTILRVTSASGRQKAFSTCGSHLTVVFLFYGTAIGVYLYPPSSHSGGEDRLAAVFYTVVTPMLNPFIYSLRNKEMKMALSRLFGIHTLSSQGL